MGTERRPTILLIEDNPDEEAMIMRAVRKSTLTCQILVAHTTDEALDFLHRRGVFASRETRNPDVIVTDLRVNPHGGADLISEVRKHPETRLIPVVVLTGSASVADIDDLYLRGANSFLEKPMDFGDFVDSISRLARYWGTLNLTAGNKQTANYSYPL